MSDLSDEFVPLVCPQCGGKIELTKAQYEENFMVAADGVSIMYIGISAAEDGARCQHCGTEFARKTKFQPGEGAMNIIAILEGDGAMAIGPGAMAVGKGGVIIGGDFSGQIITGNRNRVRHHNTDSRVITGDDNDVDL